MFRAVDHSQNGSPITSIDPQWGMTPALEKLRLLCRDDHIRCPWCHAPVLIRAGEILSRHFAHKHLNDCPHAHESGEKLAGRQIIFEWLTSKFGREFVELEVMPEGHELPMPLDVFVNKDGIRVGYWFFTRGVQSLDKRYKLIDAIADAEESNLLLHVVFSSSQLKLIDVYPGLVRLSPTHRDFGISSPYDACAGGKYTLHYLNTFEKIMTTLRGLRGFEPPQTYKFGCQHESSIDQLQIRPTTGEIVHPGEYEALQAWEAAQQCLSPKITSPSSRQTFDFKPTLPKTDHSQPPPLNMSCKKMLPDINTSKKEGSVWNSNRTAVCELCGKVTHEDDWIIYDGNTKVCKCRGCMGSPKR